MRTINYLGRQVEVFYSNNNDSITTDRGTLSVSEIEISKTIYNGRDISRLIDLNKVIEEM